jgi:phosphonate transport system substrate-binding protein
MFRFANRMLMGFMVIAGLIPGDAAPAYAGEGQHLTLGRITQEPGKNIDRLNSMAEYLSAMLAPNGIDAVNIAIVENPERMAEMLRNGEVDLFSETPFVALDLMEAGLAEPLMREWKKGVAEYHTIIVARGDGEVRSLEDLRGRKIAFEDPGSTSGYFLPRAALEEAGLSLEKLDDPRSTVTGDAVGYSFAEGEINIVAWVNRGLADAGAISNIDWENPKKAPAQLKESLTIIHETQPVIRSLMMVRRTLDAEMKERLASVLARMHETSNGKAALKKYFKVSRYDPLIGQAAAGLDSARRIWRLTRKQND